MAEECGRSVELPTGETVVCRRHRRGWHWAPARATWPELHDEDDVCGAWGVTETAEGEIFVMCGRTPQHAEQERTAHFATVAGFPKTWS